MCQLKPIYKSELQFTFKNNYLIINLINLKRIAGVYYYYKSFNVAISYTKCWFIAAACFIEDLAETTFRIPLGIRLTTSKEHLITLKLIRTKFC